MATRLKTVQFSSPTYKSTLADGVDTLTNSGSVYFPENSELTPISVKAFTIDQGWLDVVTTATNIAEYRCSLTLGTASKNTIIELDDITNTGESMGGVFGPFDFTTYAAANIGTGISQSYSVNTYCSQSSVAGPYGINNINSLITMTYEYDDLSPVQIKTVWIPFESRNTALATTETEIGTNQIPNLSTFLPESGKLIRGYFFVLEGNQQTATTTDISMSLKVDSENRHDTGYQERALASEVFARYIWDRSLDYPSTASAHAFKAWANVASYNNLVITLVVTYEFDPTATTSVLNSIYTPMEMGSPLGLENIPTRFQRTIMIQEPGTITLQQSAFRLNYNVAAAVAGLNTRMGNQPYRAYTDNGAGVCGMLCLQQRIDAGSAVGGFGSLARGRNTLTFDGYRTDTTDDPTNLNGYVLLNYTSDKHSSGVGAHSHTVFFNMSQWEALASDRWIVSAFAPSIPETDYYINSIGVVATIWDGVASNAFSADVEVKSTEGKGGGYDELYSDSIQSDAERRCSIVWAQGKDTFKRYPLDPDTNRIDAEVSRVYRFFSPSAIQLGVYFFTTYHSIVYPLTGSVSNYSGDGSGITVDIFRTYDDTKVLQLTTGVSGSFSASWHDNTENIYCVSREDNNHVGRSANAILSS